MRVSDEHNMAQDLQNTPRSLQPLVGRRQVTHDYTKRYWGHDYVFHPESGGLKAHMLGWGHGLKAGHFLIIQNGAGSTRYKINKLTYFDDPPDMWDACVTFSPRQPPNVGDQLPAPAKKI